MLDLITGIKPTLDPEKWLKIIKYFSTAERAKRWLEKKSIKQDDPTFFKYLGDKDVVEHFLKAGKHIDTLDDDKNTPLIIAAWKGHQEIVEILVEPKRKAKLDARGAYNNTALMAALLKGRTNIAKLLRKAGASEAGVPRAELIVAAERGDRARVEELVTENVDVNARDLQGNTPLILAAENGQRQVVQVLIEKGAHLYIKRKDGKTAGEVASDQGFDDIAKLLLHRGALEKLKEMGIKDEQFFRYLSVGNRTVTDLFLKAGKFVDTLDSDENQNTPLIIAAWKGHKEIVEILVEPERGANLDAREANGNTALMAAILKGHGDIAEQLRKIRATENGIERAELIVAAERGDVAKVEKLINENADVNSRDLEGNTPLILAAGRGQRQVVEMLIKKGAFVDVTNKNNMTALEVAHLQRQSDIERLLRVEHAAAPSPIAGLFHAIEKSESLKEIEDHIRPENLKVTNMEGTPALIFAVEKENLEAVRLLIARGAPVDARDVLGRTALLVATTKERADIVRELINAGADPEAADLNGQSPIMTAISSGNREIQTILLRPSNKKAEMEARLVEAVKNGDIEQVRLLLPGVNTNASVEHGLTALIAACKFDRIEIARLLIEAHADLEQPDSDDITPIMTAILYRRGEMEDLLRHEGAKEGADEARLMVAAEINDRDQIRNLLEKAKVNAGGSNGRTALMIASEQGHIEAVQELISGQAEVNARDRKRQTALMIASQLGRAEVVRELIKSNADLSATDKDQRTALMLAAREGQLEVVEALLEKLIASGKKSEMDAAGKDGRTALILAASEGHTTVVQALIARLPNLDAQDAELRTALIHAATQGHTDVVEALKTAKANIRLRDKDGKTAYMWAVDKGFPEIERLLEEAWEEVKDNDKKLSRAITRGDLEEFQRLLDTRAAKANAFDGRGRPMLIAAIESNQIDMARLLLQKYGADPGLRDKQQRTPLMVACDKRHAEVVKDLLAALKTKYPVFDDFKAKVDEKDKTGKTALLFACERKLAEAVRELIANHADPNEADDDEQTPLKVAILKRDAAIRDLLKRNGATKGEHDAYLLLAAASGNHSEVVAAIKSGANVNAKGERERTPLILASEGGHLAVVRELIEKGAEVNTAGKANETALLMASRRGHVETVRYLIIEKKAEVNPRKDKRGKTGRTPLLEAARRGFTGVVKELIHGLASVDDTTADGKTALILAASYGRTDVARALIDAKAAVNANDKNGFTALIWAASNGDVVLTDALIEKKANVNARSKTGATPLMAAILGGHNEIANKLKAARATSGELEAQLIVAVSKGDVDKVRQLTRQNVGVNAKTLDGNTALTLATERGDHNIMEELLGAGAAVNMKGYANKTALMLAAGRGDARAAGLFVAHGADVNSRSDDGSTALMYAARAGNEETVRFLLDNDADANASDRYGKTALDLARQMIDATGAASNPILQERFANIALIVEASQKAGTQKVYVTDKGDCYHRSGCVYLKNKDLKNPEKDRVYRLCTRCNPPQQ